MNIIEKLKEINQDDYFDAYSLSNDVQNWPEIPLYMDYDDDGKPIPGEDDDIEPLDMENWKVTEIGDRHMVLQAGGDWQQPHEVRIELNSDDELVAVSCVPSDFNGPDLNMDEVLGLEEEDDD